MPFVFTPEHHGSYQFCIPLPYSSLFTHTHTLPHTPTPHTHTSHTHLTPTHAHTLQKRHILEQMEQLEPRVSALEEDLSEEGESEEEEEEEEEEERVRPTHCLYISPK